MYVFMYFFLKHARFHVFSQFSAYFFPHDIVVEKCLFSICPTVLLSPLIVTCSAQNLRTYVRMNFYAMQLVGVFAA